MTADVDLATRLARVAHQLIADDMPWTGSPLAEAELEGVAMGAAGHLDIPLFIEALGEATQPGVLLQKFLAIVWAAGFKTGSMYSEERR